MTFSKSMVYICQTSTYPIRRKIWSHTKELVLPKTEREQFSLISSSWHKFTHSRLCLCQQ